MPRRADTLSERKAALAARCDAERAAFAVEAAELQARTRWIDWGWRCAVAVGPKLPMLAPVAGFLLSRHLPGASRLAGRLLTLWQMAKRAGPVVSRLRAAWGH